MKPTQNQEQETQEQSFSDKFKILMSERRARITEKGKNLFLTKAGTVAGFFGGIFLIPVLGASAALGGALIGAFTGGMMNRKGGIGSILGGAALGAGIGAFTSVKLKFLPAMVLGAIAGHYAGMALDYAHGAARCAYKAFKSDRIEPTPRAEPSLEPTPAAEPASRFSLKSLRGMFNRKPAEAAPSAPAQDYTPPAP